MEQITEKQTDEQLVERAQNGDKRAEEALLVRYLNLVRSQARRFFLVGGETEDLIQEGMIGLYHAIGDFHEKDGGKFSAFASLCVYRRIVSAVKSSLRKKNDPLNNGVAYTGEERSDLSDPETLIVLRDDMREFNRKMSRALSDFEYRVFVMYIDGMTCAEICESTDKTAKSVDNAIQRSKRKLQKILEEEKTKEIE